MKNRIAFYLIAFASIALQSHEFWIQPDRFRFHPGEKATLKFQVGENLEGEPWGGNPSRVVKLDLINSKSTRDVRPNYSEGVVHLDFTTEGTHIVAMESTEAFSKLSGEAFTRYLEEDGLDNVLAARRKEGVEKDSATELYSRHTKLLLQVGNTIDTTCTQLLGQVLEIVPLVNPYGVRPGERLRFRVLFRGKPAFGVKVLCTNKNKNRVSVQSIYTQQDGTIDLPLSSDGTWLISAVLMEKEKSGKAQWRSYWSSLLFGL